jgi:redox-sensitive bicupin YhaK (pirin superfamily)
MIRVRRSEERGHANHGWLDTYHTFSFDTYFDPHFMGFRSLRVINEDRVDGGQGFGTHPHRDMEIITYVLEGALEHKDSMGNHGQIRPGEVQRMSAGTGVRHSEFNPSPNEPVHLLQIWILPERNGLHPSYEQKTLDPASLKNKLAVVASPDAESGAVKIHQDARLLATRLDEGKSVELELTAKRYGWVQVARGSVEVNGTRLEQGDGAAVLDEEKIELRGADKNGSEVLVFDLA